MKATSALIVCPASLVYNWESEFNRFAPEMNVLAVVGTVEERQKLLEDFKQAQVPGILLTSYDLLKRDVGKVPGAFVGYNGHR